MNMKNWRIYKVRDYLNAIHLLDQSKVVVFFKCDRFWDQYTYHVHVHMANLNFTQSLKGMQTHFANIKKIVHGAIANNLTKFVAIWTYF